jgi:predicted metal-dependent hydrolase
VQAVLLRWLHYEARKHLIPLLQEISAETGLHYNRTRVANQRTRWGSYSSNGTVSINQKLLFLPPHLVRYVFLHELCHSVEPNHSPQFWALLQKHEPNTATWRKELRSADKYIPEWTKPG